MTFDINNVNFNLYRQSVDCSDIVCIYFPIEPIFLELKSSVKALHFLGEIQYFIPPVIFPVGTIFQISCWYHIVDTHKVTGHVFLRSPYKLVDKRLGIKDIYFAYFEEPFFIESQYFDEIAVDRIKDDI